MDVRFFFFLLLRLPARGMCRRGVFFYLFLLFCSRLVRFDWILSGAGRGNITPSNFVWLGGGGEQAFFFFLHAALIKSSLIIHPPAENYFSQKSATLFTDLTVRARYSIGKSNRSREL